MSFPKKINKSEYNTLYTKYISDRQNGLGDSFNNRDISIIEFNKAYTYRGSTNCVINYNNGSYIIEIRKKRVSLKDYTRKKVMHYYKFYIYKAIDDYYLVNFTHRNNTYINNRISREESKYKTIDICYLVDQYDELNNFVLKIRGFLSSTSIDFMSYISRTSQSLPQ